MFKMKDKTKLKTPKIPKIQAPITFEQKVSRNVGSIWSLYIHTVLFTISFLLIILGISAEKVLLTLTTIVSLEAIYLSIFIQMAVNKNTDSLEEVEEDLDEIQEDIDEIQEDVEEIEEDVEEIEDSDNKRDKAVNDKFKNIDNQLQLILEEIKNLRK